MKCFAKEIKQRIITVYRGIKRCGGQGDRDGGERGRGGG